MLVVNNIFTETPRLPHVVMTIGSFDGVHLGHQAILRQVVQDARRINGTAAVLTFRPHPREFFMPNHTPNLLTTEKQKIALLEHLGLDAVFFFPFNAETASLEPKDFVEKVLLGKCGVRELVVGHDFRFGRAARGDFDLLENMAPRFGFKVSQMAPLLIQGERVSSTAIRERILEGDLEQAELFLGRKFALHGRIEQGRGIGKTLGFPTANVISPRSIIPAHGVYAAEALLDGMSYPAAINIGIAPTIRQDNVVVEAHLINFSGDISGKEMELIFHHRLRPERKFPSREDLVEQIRKDVQTITEYFARLRK
ncbi:MAG TPA: bifunctional riboflavin kinase/FAD synthetase [Candidatus Hydrogenedentes bacterium]|nr:bifunctional riboflavin kinase/FAD synthetase [Candidatus Hydrogenedentota bacterium]